MKKTRSYKQLPWLFGTVAGGVILNLLGNWLMRLMSLPLYLDSVGTVLSAALGGYIPGILVGYISNLINGVSDPTNMYYAFISVLIGLSAAYFARHGWFKRVGGCIAAIVIFCLIGGGVGSIISWLLFGFDVGDIQSSPIARALVQRGVMSAFWAHFVVDMLLDLIDKALTVALVVLIIRLIPKSIRPRLMLQGWKQKPLSDEERLGILKPETRGTSLKSKIVLLITVAAVFMATATAVISFLLYHRATLEDHVQIGVGVSELAASVVDGDRIESYITGGKSASGYRETEELLKRIRESSPDIEYIYVYKIVRDGCVVVFDLDTPDVPGNQPGTMVEFDMSFLDRVPALLAGEPIDPIISDDKYGWLMTAYTPIRDSKGNTTAYAAADIAMDQVRLSEISFITRVVTLFFGFFLIVLAVGLWIAEYNLLLPINTMTSSAGEFAYNSDAAQEDNVEKFKALEIETGDEIENLYNSFASMMASSVAYLEESKAKSASLSKMQSGLILVLADLVESRDKCTGDHVRKTSAYVRTILQQMAEEGVYTDIITPEFIDDVANSAPLHDVGKISVPDSILNKPGRLSDEEFEQMKKHTTAGRDVIARAIALVSDSDSGYLAEAKNLATSHHEKWNGTGYPYGLKGSEIPLSARVMAVADVFDALVSKRSYKEPFSYDKAVSIIEEGAGSHFDPQVVAAFMHAQAEVKKIYETNMMDAEEGGYLS